MRKFTYWVSEHLTANGHAYNLRAKTRREVTDLITTYEYGETTDYGCPHKVTIEYTDLIDLVSHVAGEAFYEGS